MNKTILVVGVILGLTAVILGAFGAHGLEKLVSKENVETFSTGVTYQMYHALLLLFLGSTNFITSSSKKAIFYLIIGGVLLFSGSIYSLATNELTAFDFKKIAFLTPIGGSLLIFGWILLGIRIFRQRD
ncbi:DUF423 domain-containing protein [Sediminicola arcticus]|jgi:uncharacterized membrane protein YgdD (TMEM256/DUF423 family)|uniref:DUF423 domain-containing protein n=1 Tax=Sediminicola arcticus TaxID=1574308 RepID=A0ABV2SPY9_9FLAO